MSKYNKYSYFDNFVKHLSAEISLYPDIYKKGGINASLYHMKMNHPNLFYKNVKSNKSKSFFIKK